MLAKLHSPFHTNIMFGSVASPSLCVLHFAFCTYKIAEAILFITALFPSNSIIESADNA